MKFELKLCILLSIRFVQTTEERRRRKSPEEERLKMDEEAETQTPKRRKTVTPKRIVSPETGNNVASSRDTQIRNQEKSPKAERPPPIYIKNVTKVNALLKNITMTNPGDFFHSAGNNRLKLTFKTIDRYRKAIHYLEGTTAEYRTLQIKSEKPFRVVIRGLHPEEHWLVY